MTGIEFTLAGGKAGHFAAALTAIKRKLRTLRNTGPTMLFSVTRRHPASRTARVIAALCVLLMVASNALAAMGLCIVKAAATDPVSVTLSDEAPCAQHVNEATRNSSEPSAQQHCPQDDPGAQLRSGDIPAAVSLVAIASPLRVAIVDPASVARASGAHDASPPAPLYSRLSRLLL